MPAAEEQDHDQERRCDHVEELGHEEQKELDAGIFGVVATDELLLRLGEVEREPRRLGEARHHEDDEAQRLGKRIPHARLRLGVHDRVEPEAAGGQNDAQQPEAEGDLGNELGARPQATEEAVFIVARPAPEKDAVDRDARQREDPQHADVEARRHEEGDRIGEAGDPQWREDASERDRREDRQGRSQNHQRRCVVENAVDAARREIFLEDDLQAVGQRLTEAEEADLREWDPDPVRPAAILHPGGDPPLQEHEVGRRGHQPADEQADLHKRRKGCRRGEKIHGRGFVAVGTGVDVGGEPGAIEGPNQSGRGELVDAEIDADGGEVPAECGQSGG